MVFVPAAAFRRHKGFKGCLPCLLTRANGCGCLLWISKGIAVLLNRFFEGQVLLLHQVSDGSDPVQDWCAGVLSPGQRQVRRRSAVVFKPAGQLHSASVVTNGPAKAVFSFQLPSDGDEPLFSLCGHDRLPRGSCSELCAEWLQQSRTGCNFCAHGLTANPVTPIDFSSDYENLTPLPAPTDQLPSKQSVDGSNPSGGVYDEAISTKTSWNGSNGLWSPPEC